MQRFLPGRFVYLHSSSQSQHVLILVLLALSDSLFDRIKNSPAKQYMRNLVELNIDFTSPDPNFFSIDAPEAFFPVFNPEQGGALLEFEIDTMAKRVRSLTHTRH